MSDTSNALAEIGPAGVEPADNGMDEAVDLPRDAAPWKKAIDDATKYFEGYQDHCDNIDKVYADLEALAGSSSDRELQIFWANMEVMAPTVYSRPPVPVVQPRHRRRDELARKAADVLERSLITDFDLDDVDSTIREVRNDLLHGARGVPWLRYDDSEGFQRVLAEHVDRRDFLHEPARKWKEVGWVARRSYLTVQKGVQRFGPAFLDIELEERGADPSAEDRDSHYPGEKKGMVWEIWHKVRGVVAWYAPGAEELLDIRQPHLRLDGFFPCPRPAFGTLERRKLIPVPDFLFYKDQIEEINELTTRISSLAESLRLRGFYPSGAGDLTEAVEAALDMADQGKVLVGVSNFAALGDRTLKDAIVWLPIDMVATVMRECIDLRRQLIEDVYQITGLSDIMRGSTEATETLGAQQLKAQFGATRIREKQGEIARIARDITRMKGEIMAETFEAETFTALAQIDDIPTAEQLNQQITGIQQKLMAARNDPQLMQAAAQNPQVVQQIRQQADQQIAQIKATITMEHIVELLRQDRIRPFTLDIETDSTIQPDEQAEKERRTEFLTAVGGFITQAQPILQAFPQGAPFVAEALKFAAGGFRAGRRIDEVIDELAETLRELPQQDQGPSPEELELQLKQAAEAAKQKLEEQRFQMEKGKAAKELELEERRLQLEERRVVSEEENREFERVDRAETREIEQRNRAEDKAGEREMEYLRSGLPDGYVVEQRDAILKEVKETAEDMERAVAAAVEGQQAQINQLMQAIEKLTQAVMAPKRLVRDQSGRPIGVEPTPPGSEGEGNGSA